MHRMRRPTALLAAGSVTIVVTFDFLMPQVAGAGVLVKLLTGMPYQSAGILVGAAMIIYVAFGGMLATTWVQIVKAVLMLAAAAIILMMVLAIVRFDPLTLFQQAETRYGPQYLMPGNYLTQ